MARALYGYSCNRARAILGLGPGLKQGLGPRLWLETSQVSHKTPGNNLGKMVAVLDKPNVTYFNNITKEH